MPRDFLKKAGEILDRYWSRVREQAKKVSLSDCLDDNDLIAKIRACVNSKTKSYRYVLPTQLLAKLANSSLDCRSVQVARGEPGSFDARTIAHRIVVPFDQANDSVLGGSPEPYVNNPLRVPEISARYGKAQRNREDWDDLCTILDGVEDKEQREYTCALFRQVLTEIYRRFSAVSVLYPVPKRVSLERTIKVMEDFLSERSGGDRLLALTSALFLIIGKRFQLYADVRREAVTSADAATGMVADLECLSEKGEVVVAVEVKDRELTVSQIRSKIPDVRQKHVSEMFFIAERGVAPCNHDDAAELVRHEFASGHNLYVMDLLSLGRVVLALLGEEGRIEFLAEVGRQLDQYRSDIVHRQAWAQLLRDV